MDSSHKAGQSYSVVDGGLWEYPFSDRYSTGVNSDEATVSGGEVYRTVSDAGLDSSDFEAPFTFNELHADLRLKLKSINPSVEFNSRTSELIAKMTCIVTEYLEKSASLVPYGSIATNLYSDKGSVDLMLFVPPGSFDALFGVDGGLGSHYADIPVAILKEFELRQAMRRALSRLGELFTVFCGLYVVKVTGVVPVLSVSAGSRVPVLTMTDPESAITFEISCNNTFSLFSTRLLRAYDALLPELRDLVQLVKCWARRQKLLGTLSGFAWSLLCVFYCQACLGVLPSLQAACKERQQWTDPFGSNRRYDVGFEENYAIPQPQSTLDGPSLFLGFLDYWSNYWNWSNGVVSVRLGRGVVMGSPEVFIRQSSVVTEGRSVLIIEDPFDIKKDLCQHTGCLDKVRETMRTTLEQLNMGVTSNLF